MPEITSPLKAIRAYCLDCCGGQANEVKLCPAEDCPLYPFRFGKNPYRKPPSEAQIENARENMKRLHESKTTV